MKKMLSCWLLASLFLFAAGLVQARDMSQGCLDNNGTPIAAVADGKLEMLVKTQIDNGRPRIHYNGKIVPELTAKQRLFFFANECARINMNQAAVEELTLEQAREADCRAISLLFRSGVVQNVQDLNATAGKMVLSDAAWLFIPGPQREVEVAGCLSQTSVYNDQGNLKRLPGANDMAQEPIATAEAPVATDKGTVLETGGWRHTPNWDRCVRVCAEPLRRCGKVTSGPCMDRYNQCVANCGSR